MSVLAQRYLPLLDSPKDFENILTEKDIHRKSRAALYKKLFLIEKSRFVNMLHKSPDLLGDILDFSFLQHYLLDDIKSFPNQKDILTQIIKKKSCKYITDEHFDIIKDDHNLVKLAISNGQYKLIHEFANVHILKSLLADNDTLINVLDYIDDKIIIYPKIEKKILKSYRPADFLTKVIKPQQSSKRQ